MGKLGEPVPELSVLLSSLVWAALTDTLDEGWGGSQRMFMSHSSGGEKSKVKGAKHHQFW